MKLRILYILLSLLPVISYAQGKTARCGTEFYSNQEYYPLTENEYIDARLKMVARSRAKRTNLTTANITIPVVFHIVYNTPEQNIDDNKIFEQLDVLNKTYNKNYSDAGSIPSEFRERSSSIDIKFCIAGKNEYGEFTSGIIRKHTGKTLIGTDSSLFYNELGGSTAWDTERYLNIWVANTGQYLSGYAQYPWVDNKYKDGVVIGADFMGSSADGVNLGMTLVHEVGHYLGLFHLWRSTSCEDDDEIDDTPFQNKPYYGCPQYPQYSCNSSDMFMNYMDYVDDGCMFMFTYGQKERIWDIVDKFRGKLLENSKNSICQRFSSDDDVNFEVFPNPCMEYLKLKISYAEFRDYDITFYDSKGIVKKLPQISDNTYDISSLSSGVYIIKVGTAVKKVIKL